MSNYPPPPPPDQHHYNSLYQTSAGSQQMVDPATQQSHLQYTNLAQQPYSKVETAPPISDASAQIHHTLAQELQRHTEHDDQSHHHIPQMSQALPQQQQPAQQSNAQHQANQHQHPQPQSSFLIQQSQQQPVEQSPDQAAKSNRLRKACDSCSIRKVKCDESGPPCRACSALDIPCTFERPSRRRGPPNRHAEAIKKRKVEDVTGGSYSAPSSPSSPTHAAQALAALSSHTSSQQLSAESICPIETLDLLINDFFTYIHPLCPFPHEPSFREAWKRREDLSNKSFLALLASMIGALVASFPRKPRLHLKAQRRESLFPNHMSLVHRCQSVCALARGPGYLENEHLSVYDAATSYFLALMGIYTFRWRQGRLYFGECLTIIRTLGLHKARDGLGLQLGTLPALLGSLESDDRQQVVDKITLEIGRRIFWTMFVSVKTVQQLGAAFSELQIPPPTTSEPYPPLPTEVDDFCIYPDHIDAQPAGLLPVIAGFNANVRAYSSYNSLATMEMAWGIDNVVDWERQRRVLKEALRRCKDAIASMPAELKVNVGDHSTGSEQHQQNGASGNIAGFLTPSAAKRDPARTLLSAESQGTEVPEQTAEERRRVQYEIQKANIYASSLATRSYIVEKYWNLVEAYARSRSQQTPGSLPSSPGLGITAAGIDGMIAQQAAAPTNAGHEETEREFREEREKIMKDLLIVLSSIDQVNMEPNADSFTMKIRSIASTLLDGPDSRKGQMEIQTQQYLSAFLDILMKLERVSPANSDPEQGEDDATELGHWADLREYQRKFAQQGGVLGMS